MRNAEPLPRDPHGPPAVVFTRFEREGWERAASLYGACWAPLTLQFVAPLLDALGVAAGTRLLDVCCGSGDLAAAAASRGATTVGLDFAPRMLAGARRRHPQLDFREGDAQALPFEPRSFDRVATNFGVAHLAEPELAFTEARQVLATGGRFGFTVWARASLNPLARLVEDAVAAHGDGFAVPAVAHVVTAVIG